MNLETINRLRSRDSFWLLVIVAACAAIMLPMVVMGVPEGFDILDHLSFSSAFEAAVRRGGLMVHWSAADNFGYGSVGTRFYPPFSDLLTGVVNIFTKDWYTSFLISAVFWMIPGSIGIYFWAREFFGRGQAAFSAVLYALMPYHLFEIYQYTFVSEFAAAAVLPFCFWMLTRLMLRGRRIDVLLFAIASSILIVTHLPTIITGAVTLAIYASCLVDRKKLWRTVANLAISGVIALAATSFYWLRLVTEIGLVAHNGDENVSGAQAFSYHLFPVYFSARPEFYRLKMLWLMDDNTLITILLFLPAAVCLAAGLHRGLDELAKKVFTATVVAALAALVLTTYPSKFIWEYAPVLSKIQFPWRFLSPASIAVSVVCVPAISLLYEHLIKLRRFVIYGTMIVLGLVVIYDLGDLILASAPYSRQQFAERYGNLNDKKGCECWYPAGAEARALDIRDRITGSSRAFQITSWEAESRDISFAAGEPETVRIATFWYPHWQATINGGSVEVGKDENGVIEVKIPSDASEMQLRFVEPRMLLLSEYFSLAVWIGILATIGWFVTHPGKVNINQTTSLP